jgi:processive 1,2-diacylglycerol beta-glucosyltransferase
MFFEMVFYVWILIKFDQNPANHVKKITQATPNNNKLQKTLTKEFGFNKNITILGYTDRISTLMDACGVHFTKPGGLSSSEAAAKKIPIIHTAPIPGCETKNAEFFHYHGMSYNSSDITEQVI